VPDLHRSRALLAAAAVAIAFGLLTIVSGARALFGGADMGDVVPFILWFNFLAGFAYVVAGIGLWRGTSWGWWMSLGIAGATALVLLAFLAHVLLGNPYELRTLGAMVLRLGVWTMITATAQRAVLSDECELVSVIRGAGGLRPSRADATRRERRHD
jgi:hypothetical protein